MGIREEGAVPQVRGKINVLESDKIGEHHTSQYKNLNYNLRTEEPGGKGGTQTIRELGKGTLRRNLNLFKDS